MTSKTINFNTPVDLKDVPGLIMAIGEQRTVLLRGEPGIGKSTVLKMLEQAHKGTHDIEFNFLTHLAPTYRDQR